MGKLEITKPMYMLIVTQQFKPNMNGKIRRVDLD